MNRATTGVAVITAPAQNIAQFCEKAWSIKNCKPSAKVYCSGLLKTPDG